MDGVWYFSRSSFRVRIGRAPIVLSFVKLLLIGIQFLLRAGGVLVKLLLKETKAGSLKSF